MKYRFKDNKRRVELVEKEKKRDLKKGSKVVLKKRVLKLEERPWLTNQLIYC